MWLYRHEHTGGKGLILTNTVSWPSTEWNVSKWMPSFIAFQKKTIWIKHIRIWKKSGVPVQKICVHQYCNSRWQHMVHCKWTEITVTFLMINWLQYCSCAIQMPASYSVKKENYVEVLPIYRMQFAWRVTKCGWQKCLGTSITACARPQIAKHKSGPFTILASFHVWRTCQRSVISRMQWRFKFLQRLCSRSHMMAPRNVLNN
jgi:hypothetical protein